MISSSKKGIHNPDDKWMRDAKWGFFTHYLAHMASKPVPVMPKKQWIKKVNSFNVRQFGDQLSALKAPYCFITIGQAGNYFCSPNESFDKHFGANTGARPERDLIADVAAELLPRGIRMCVYSPAYGARGSSDEQKMWLDVFTEWSERWGESISAWWADGTAYPDYSVYRAYFDALKTGNRNALVATKLWGKLPANQVLEDYLGGESGFLLEVTSTRYNHFRKGVTDKIPLHFLTFLGEFWGIGEPRFPVEVVTGWTQHINNLGGTVSWDCPVTDSGEIPEKVYEQLAVLSRSV